MLWKGIIMKYILTICIAASWNYIVTAQNTGEACIQKNGLPGVCQPLHHCRDAVSKATRGESPELCNFDSDLITVCCPNIVTFQYQPLNDPSLGGISIKRQSERNPGQDSQYVIFQNVPDLYSRHPIIRYPRGDKPWWFAESPFTSTTTPKEQRENTNVDNLDSPWWVMEKPFYPASQPVILPPTIPPSLPRQTPSPVTRPENPLTRRSQSAGPKRISEIKCDEYSRLAVEQIQALPLIPTPEPVRLNIPKCDFSSLQLIVGGEETKPKEFPHMAALGYKEGGTIEWRCGGSLISEYYVVTAAHCTPNKNPPIVARLGELNLKRGDDGAAPVNYAIVERKRHPDYKPPAKYNDIALLKLDRRVQFSDFIRPACLYTRDYFDVNKTVATGWGKIDFAEKQSDTLLKVAISIIDNMVCNDLYELDGVTRELSKGISSSMMCAGELAGGKDTCQGDSGGPIQITQPSNQCVYSIIGVTSFGKFCAAKNAPGVYTRISSYVPWIESIVWPES